MQALQEDLATAEVPQGGAPDDELQGGLDDSLFDVDDLISILLDRPQCTSVRNFKFIHSLVVLQYVLP